MSVTYEELKDERKMSYPVLFTYLQGKYGVPKGNYYTDKSLLTKNEEIERSKDGLMVHHFYENQDIGLELEEFNKRYPFYYQERINLCYCAYLEHMILQTAILKDHKTFMKNYERKHMILGAFEMEGKLIPDFNDYINGTYWHEPEVRELFLSTKNFTEEYYDIVAEYIKTIKWYKSLPVVIDNEKRSGVLKGSLLLIGLSGRDLSFGNRGGLCKEAKKEILKRIEIK